jgi:hypothetical protein
MPEYLVANYLPDDDQSKEDEAMVQFSTSPMWTLSTFR